VLTTILGLFVGFGAKTAVDQIAAMILAVVAAIFWTGAAIVRAIRSLGPAPALSGAIAPATVPPDSPHQWG
jgi:hypothetical protein